MLAGGCRCGAVRYEVDGEPTHKSLCHCVDCRASSGAPMVGWFSCPAAVFRLVSGAVKEWHGTGASYRYFCTTCGTGLYFINEEMLPGLVDIQIATLDDPESCAPEAHVQVADRLGWMTGIADLPEFDRYPGG